MADFGATADILCTMGDDSAAPRAEALALLDKVRGFVTLPGQS